MFKIVNNFNEDDLNHLLHRLDITDHKIEKKTFTFTVNGQLSTVKKANTRDDVYMQNMVMSRYLAHYSVFYKFKDLIIPFERLDNELKISLERAAQRDQTTGNDFYLNMLLLNNTQREISEMFNIDQKVIMLIKSANRKRIIAKIIKEKKGQKC